MSSISKIKQHLDQTHLMFLREKKSKVISFLEIPKELEGTIMWNTQVLKYDHCTFFGCVRRNQDGHWYLWVYLLGPEVIANRYKFTIQIYKDDKSQLLTYEGNCLSTYLKKGEIHKHGKCLIVTDKTIEDFATKDELNLSLEVDKIKKGKKKND